MPSLRAVLMMRQAISPRLAIRIFLNMRSTVWKGSGPQPRRCRTIATPAVRGPTPADRFLGRRSGLVDQLLQARVDRRAFRLEEGEEGLLVGRELAIAAEAGG